MSDRPFIPVRIAVLTVSDTRTPATDKSGDTLADRIKEAGHRLADRQIIFPVRLAVAERKTVSCLPLRQKSSSGLPHGPKFCGGNDRAVPSRAR